jgi:hypothetical protein
MLEERCTCGDTDVTYYADENQVEPNCWDCYFQEKENSQSYDDSDM